MPTAGGGACATTDSRGARGRCDDARLPTLSRTQARRFPEHAKQRAHAVPRSRTVARPYSGFLAAMYSDWETRTASDCLAAIAAAFSAALPERIARGWAPHSA